MPKFIPSKQESMLGGSCLVTRIFQCSSISPSSLTSRQTIKQRGDDSCGAALQGTLDRHSKRSIKSNQHSPCLVCRIRKNVNVVSGLSLSHLLILPLGSQMSSILFLPRRNFNILMKQILFFINFSLQFPSLFFVGYLEKQSFCGSERRLSKPGEKVETEFGEGYKVWVGAAIDLSSSDSSSPLLGYRISSSKFPFFLLNFLSFTR